MHSNFMRRRFAGICFLFVAGLMVVNGYGASTVAINVDSAQYVVKNELFGVLMERLAKNWVGGVFVGTTSSVPNTNGMRNDMINGFKECGLGCIEWPGGCAANNYNWKSSGANPANDVGTDRFMQLCGLIGCEPVLALPPAVSAAASNLDWIKYINNNASHPEWTVKYVKIGNEMWGGCGTTYTEATYEPFFRATYDSIKAPINGKKLFVVAAGGQIGSYPWQDSLETRMRDKIDGIEVHDYVYKTNYPCVNFTPAQYADVVNAANNGQIGPRVTTLIQHLDKYDTLKTRKIKLCEDEWGDWLADFGSNMGSWWKQVTVMDLLSGAEQLHIFMKNTDYYQMATLAQGVNCLQSIFLTATTNGKLIKTPCFYLFKMYKAHHSNGAKWAPNVLSSDKFGTMDALSVGSTVDNSGKLNISISNVDTLTPRPITITVNSRIVGSWRIDSAQIITGAAKNSYNDTTMDTVNIKPFAAANYSLTNGNTITVNMPVISVVTLSLTPATPSAIGHAPMQNFGEKSFSVKAGPHGTVCISAFSAQAKPVKISLYNAEGKLVAKASQMFTTANSSFTLGNNLRGNGLYMVKVESANSSFTKNLVLAR